MTDTMTSQNIDLSSWDTLYMPSFIKTGLGIQKLKEGDSQTQRQHGDRISLLLFFKNGESITSPLNRTDWGALNKSMISE
jgi:hypothetical protein